MTGIAEMFDELSWRRDDYDYALESWCTQRRAEKRAYDAAYNADPWNRRREAQRKQEAWNRDREAFRKAWRLRQREYRARKRAEQGIQPRRRKTPEEVKAAKREYQNRRYREEPAYRERARQRMRDYLQRRAA